MHKHLELVVVDDGEDSVQDLCKQVKNVRYIRHSPVKIGTARNIACDAAKGAIICHWDNDDWHSALRCSNIRTQFDNRDIRLTGYRDPVYLHLSELSFYQFHYPVDKPWVVGNTMAYKKDLWQRNNFPDKQIGEDNEFCTKVERKELIQLKDVHDVIGLIHRNNTSEKVISPKLWRKYQDIRSLLDEDFCFYEQLVKDGLY